MKWAEPSDGRAWRRPLADTDRPITEIAFTTRWQSLGTFGRTFRDVTGEDPSTWRRRVRPTARELEPVPACVVKAAHRPILKSAVSEKRRRGAGGTKRRGTKEIP